MGTKDIKKDIRHKKQRDRMENATGGGGGGGASAAIFEEVDFETQLLQGEHELRAGDPRRAVAYLTQAIESAPEGNEEPYMLRSI